MCIARKGDFAIDPFNVGDSLGEAKSHFLRNHINAQDVTTRSGTIHPQANNGFHLSRALRGVSHCQMYVNFICSEIFFQHSVSKKDACIC